MTAEGADNRETGPVTGSPPEEAPSGAPEAGGSIIDDVGALLEDGKTYAEAELAFQKTRLAYVLENAKSVAVLGGIAAILVVLAIVALVVGILISLIPALTPIGATLAVTFGLLITAAILGLFARRQIGKISRAFEAEQK